MGAFSSFEAAIQGFWTQWWIPVAVLVSLTLQLILLLAGGTRRWSRLLRIIAWNAYNWSDYIATLALGGMVQNAIGSGNKIYAVWAPILLLHLGAPDNISAFALEDNELWVRHGLLMMFHVLAAIFIVINCARGWHYILLSSCLMLAGPIKYAERTLALRSASKSATIQAVLPIYRFMLLEHLLAQLIPTRSANVKGEVANPDQYFYIISGEKQWFHHLMNQFSSWTDQCRPEAYIRAAELTSNFVTLEDIFDDPVLSKTPEIPRICLAFALFKMYRRRFSGLHMYEWRQHKARRLFLQYSGPVFRNGFREMDILGVLKVELQFMFDSLYTKSVDTAFTKLGFLFRISTTISLIVSASMLKLMNTELRQQDLIVNQARMVTFLLVAAALVVEICQLIRLVRSDWTKLWLACTYVQLVDKDHSKIIRSVRTDRSMSRKLIAKVWRSLIRRCLTRIMTVGSTRLPAHAEYGKNCIGQYALIDHVLRTTYYVRTSAPLEDKKKTLSYRSMLVHLSDLCAQKVMNQIYHHHSRIKEWQIIHKLVPSENETDSYMVSLFTEKVVRDVLDLCRRLVDLVHEQEEQDPLSRYLMINTVIRKRPWRRSIEEYCVYIACDRKHSKSPESLALSWHLATTVCELLDDADRGTIDNVDHNNTNNSLEITIKVVKLLSRYIVHLLVHKAELLPCHADIARHKASTAQWGLCSILADAYRYVMSSPSNHCQLANSNPVHLKLLMHILLMRSADLRLQVCEYQHGTGADVQQVLVTIQKLEDEYGKQNHIVEGLSDSLQVPKDVRPGLMAGKLLVLGITNREQRWRFIWDFWIEILASLASPNNCNEYLKQLTMGDEFLTYIWVLLGHMGFGTRI